LPAIAGDWPMPELRKADLPNSWLCREGVDLEQSRDKQS
jgi:hypothetical protein